MLWCIEEIQKENGGNDASRYHGFDTDVTANGNGAATANGSTYDGESLRKRFFYGSIAEDDGVADHSLFCQMQGLEKRIKRGK